MARLQKKAGRHYAVVLKTDSGWKTISTGTDNLEEAKSFLRSAYVRELETAGRVTKLTQEVISVITSGKKITVDYAVESWKRWLEFNTGSDKTRSNLHSLIAQWMAFSKVSGRMMNSITNEDLQPWINANDGTKKGTRKLRLSAIRNLFKFCSANGWCIGNPSMLCFVDMSKLSHDQMETKEVEPFTNMEVLQLLAYIGNEIDYIKRVQFYDQRKVNRLRFWRSAVKIAWATGLRLGDICGLEWASLRDGRLTVWTDKTDTRVNFTEIDDMLSEAVADIPKNQGQYAFPEQRAMQTDPERRAILSTDFKRIAAAAGIKKSFHALRHSFITRKLAEGETPKEVSKMVGHRSEETQKIYDHNGD